MTAIREYDGGGLLMAVTDAEQALDAANRRRGQAELLRQAREPAALGLARDAARQAVAANFELPLRAAGLDATVVARFAGDGPSTKQMDRSRSLDEVYGNAR